MAHVQLRNIRKTYGTHVALNDVTLSIARGAFFTLLGPSGCGKTTLLRAIAGFHQQDAGDILLEGQSIGHLGANKRNVGMVFQDYALFPHLTVEENVAFGLGRKQPQDAHLRVRQLLATVGLHGQGDKFPHELSGGQQQRVALARALAPRPELILLDEPFSNLDVGLRERLSLEVREILKREGSTAIMVTHDQHEAFAMADTVGVMRKGRIEQ